MTMFLASLRGAPPARASRRRHPSVSMRPARLSLLSGLLLVIIAAPVSAELEHIIVTARKRAENADAIPLQLSNFSRDDIDTNRIVDLDDFVELSPTLQRVRNGNDVETVLLIRGIGNYGVGEPSVGFFMDGGYRAAGSFATSHVFDIERIEVLHGPQGTLYGKSTTGGAINVIPKRPSHEPTAEFAATAASDALYRASGAVNGSLNGDTLAGRFAFSYEDFSGFYRNRFLNEPVDDNRQAGFRGTLQWEPSAALLVRPMLYYREQDQHGFALTRVSGPRDFDNEFFSRNESNDFTVDAVGAQLFAEYAHEHFTVTSLSAWNRNDESFEVDLDYQPLPLFFADRSFDRTDYSQELRVRSPDTARWRWQAGTFYYYLRGDFRQRILTLGPNGPPLSPQQSLSRATTWSAFAQTDIDVIDAVTVTGGIRYDYDLRRQGLATLSRRASFNNVSGNAAVTWHLGARSNVYASISRMFRPGGFNEGGLPGFSDEKATVYELGFKTRPLDWLAASGAVFNNRIKDAQNLDIDLATVTEITANKGNAEIIGFEVQLSATPLTGLTVDLSGSWLDHEYNNYRAFRFGPAGPAVIDFTGNDLQWVADYQALAAVDYRRPLALFGRSLTGAVTVNASFLGPMAWDDFNSAFSDDRQVVDVTLALEHPRWRAQLFVDNLFNAEFFTNFVSAFRFPFAGSDLAAPGPERQVGVRVTWRF